MSALQVKVCVAAAECMNLRLTPLSQRQFFYHFAHDPRCDLSHPKPAGNTYFCWFFSFIIILSILRAEVCLALAAESYPGILPPRYHRTVTPPYFTAVGFIFTSAGGLG